jgi:hypothetical protein
LATTEKASNDLLREGFFAQHFFLPGMAIFFVIFILPT